MFVLLSIKPKFVDAIIRGNKKYEFRKSIFKDKNINKVYMYSTSPIKKVLGSFTVGEIKEGNPFTLWSEFNEFSGVDANEFFLYFKNREKGFAIEIRNVEQFIEPIDPRNVIPGFTPPQSFHYIKNDIF